MMRWVLPVLLGGLFLFVGCVSTARVPPSPPPLEDNAPQIPEYPPLMKTYETQARLFVESTLWFQGALETLLAQAGYPIVTEKDYWRAKLCPPDWIVRPLYYARECYIEGGETYIYGRVWVGIRAPLLYPEKISDTSICKPRIFQAHARRKIGVGKIDYSLTSNEMREGVIQDALKNLLLLPEFREALQVPAITTNP